MPALPAAEEAGELPPPHATVRAIAATVAVIREKDTFMPAAYASAISVQFLTC